MAKLLSQSPACNLTCRESPHRLKFPPGIDLPPASRNETHAADFSALDSLYRRPAGSDVENDNWQGGKLAAVARPDFVRYQHGNTSPYRVEQDRECRLATAAA